jgi:hypothetical protein
MCSTALPARHLELRRRDDDPGQACILAPQGERSALANVGLTGGASAVVLGGDYFPTHDGVTAVDGILASNSGGHDIPGASELNECDRAIPAYNMDRVTTVVADDVCLVLGRVMDEG